MPINTSEVDKIMDFILRVSPLEDEQTADYFEGVKESVKAAKDNMADNEEKYAILLDSVTRWMNQLVFTLFRSNKLTPEIEAEYRSFKTVNETTEAARAFADVRQKEIDRINEEHAVVARQQNGIDIFRAIIGGMSAEEAKAKMEEYEEKLSQAQAQLKK